jgi:hypothetical protein
VALPWTQTVAAYTQAPRAKDHLSWGLVLVLAGAQVQHFTAGFRLTADDVLFHFWALQGLPELLSQTWAVAVNQGRIGHLAIVPMNALADYFVDSYEIRVLVALIYFASFLIFSFYMSAVTRSNISLHLFLILMTLHPLAYYHLPPTSYPLHLSVALFFLFVCRLSVWHLRWKPGGRSRAIFPEAMFALLLAVCMTTSEYMFVVGTALMAVEWCATFFWRRSEGILDGRHVAKGILLDSRLGIDALAVAVSLAAYVSFRLIHPSEYTGNSADGLGNIEAFSATLVKHVYAGTPLPYLSRVIFQSPSEQWLLAACFSISTFGAALASVRNLSRLRAPWFVGLVSIMFAAYVTAPIAAGARFQEWCMGTVQCAYLDSRLSYFGVALATVAGVAALTRSFSGRLNTVLTAMVCAALAALAGLTYIQNWNRAEDMRDLVSAWERASKMACERESVSVDDTSLLAFIDPQDRVPRHPDFPIARYWRLYMADRNAALSCTSEARTFVGNGGLH